MNIIEGDVLEHIKTLKDYSQDHIFSDIPYNLSSKWFIDKKTGRPEVKGKASDFMNKWDGLDSDSLELLFKEFYRVLGHGGYALLFNIDRQQDIFTYFARKAGFEVSQHMYYYFLSSFPKAHDVSRAIDKRLGVARKKIPNPLAKKQTGHEAINCYHDKNGCEYIEPYAASGLAEKYSGTKYSISPFKQVMETILVFRKPLKNKNILNDIFEYEKDIEEKGHSDISPAIINIENGRVAIDKDIEPDNRVGTNVKMSANNKSWVLANKTDKHVQVYNDSGRYPGQLFLSDGFNIDIEKLIRISNQDTITKEDSIIIDFIDLSFSGLCKMSPDEIKQYVKDWNNQFSCAEILNQQSGKLKSGNNCVRTKPGDGYHGNFGKAGDEQIAYGDEGFSSRICHHIRYEEQEVTDIVLFNQKVTRNEREFGCASLNDTEKHAGGIYSQSPVCVTCEKTINGLNDHSNCSGKIYYRDMESKIIKNNHPSLKPLSLNSSILKLFSTQGINKKLYVPFAGVFSEVIGSIFAGFNPEDITACEINPEYIKIGKARLEAWQKLYNDGFNFNTRTNHAQIKKEISGSKKKGKKIQKKRKKIPTLF